MLAQNAPLKALVVRGSVLTFAGQGGAQLIRLVKNLVLTRLLFPEAFGLMSVVMVVLYGLEMFSDAGIGPAIVRDKRGEERAFLDTAWTMQIVRGGLLWLGSLLAAYPLSLMFRAPELSELIPVAGSMALINGLRSTALHTCSRRLNLRPVIAIELATEVVSFAAVVSWAWMSPDAWALVGGALIGRLFHAGASHCLLPGARTRLRWDRASVHAILDFGKWIYLSSILHFISVQGDRLLLARLLSMSQLGVYSIATTLAEAIYTLLVKTIRGVLLPAYGHVARSDAARLRELASRTRLGLDVILVLPIAALLTAGEILVETLYDARYHGAGWILQILCVRLLLSVSSLNGEVCLVALGHTRYAFLMSLGRATWTVTAIPLGWLVGGVEGVVWAVALSEVPALSVVWYGMKQQHLLSFLAETRSLLFTSLGAVAGLGILRVLPP